MSNQSYWERRKAQNMFYYMEQAERAADEIAKVYRKSSRILSLEMDQIFERFQKKHKLSETEARRLLSTIYDKSSIDRVKRTLGTSSGQDAKNLLAELESAAYQARLERLKQLQNEIDLMMQQVYNQEKQISTSHYVDLANESYYRSIFEIQRETGLGFAFDLISEEAVDRILSSKWSGENYSQRIWKNTRGLADDLKEELMVNLLTGRTDREAAELIANKFASGASQARRLVRTESCFLANQMEMESYEECGIEKYRFLATLDLRTSKTCRSLDGKTFLVSEQMPGVNCPPMHPWCRSTTICCIEDDELQEMMRRARDLETGKTYKVPADMTYGEWYKEKVKGHPDAELAEKMHVNRYADKKQHKEYLAVLGSNIPDNLEDFQKLKYNDTEKWKSRV